MKYITSIVVALLLCVFIFVPGVRAQTASTTADLLTYISQLLNRIQSLEKEVSTLKEALQSSENNLASTREQLSLERVLRKGMSGEDVRQLQETLRQLTDIYPEGLVTGYYGALTEAAVKRFQEKQAIVSGGEPETTGFGQVGPRTVAKLNIVVQVPGTVGTVNLPPPAIPTPAVSLSTTTNSTSTTTPATSSSTSTTTSSSGNSSTSSSSSSSSSSGSSSGSSSSGSSSGSSSSSSSSAASSTPDTTAPTVSITSPAAGATVSGVVTVTADASDATGVSGVQFKLDGSNLSTEDSGAPYSANWVTTSATNGSHTLTAVARDAAGNTTSSSVTVTVNNTQAFTVDFGISGVENLNPTMTAGASASIVIQPYLYECMSCSESPATSLVAFYTDYYPNDPPYSDFDWIMTNAPRYGQQTISVPPLTRGTQTPVEWTGTLPAAGHYMFVIKIDPSNTEAESNENNNGFRSEFYTN